MTAAWDLSCPDWWQRMQDGRPLVPDLPLFQDEADKAVRAFDLLRLADVPGLPRLGPQLPGDAEQGIEGDACGEWFRAIVRALFGSYDRAARRRMIREIFGLVPKKQSKTSYSALVMLTALLLNERPRAPFMLTAPVQDTADMAFQQAWGAIEADDVLGKKLHVKPHLKTIVHRETKAELEILTFDPAVVTGKKPVGVMIDELHVIGKMAKAASAMRQIRGGMLPFPEAFLLSITTQSEEQPTGVFAEDLEIARAVRDGKSKAPILPVLYEFPKEVQESKEQPLFWRNPRNWHLVMPNLGRSAHLADLEQMCETAEAKSEAEFRGWASQHLNIQIGVALKFGGWAGADFWEQNEDPTLVDLEELLRRCEVFTIGIDGGGLDDLLGLVVMGREKRTRRWLVWAHGWAHKIVLERRKEVAPRLLQFQEQGDLTIVDLPGQDVEQVADIVCRVRDTGRLPEKNAIGVDAVGIGDVVDELQSPARGIDEAQIVAISQGYKLNGAIKTAERKLAGGEIVHSGRPFMAWCIGNAKVEPKGNAVVITKAASGTAKIDPLMAMLNAGALMALNPEANVIDEGYELLTV